MKTFYKGILENYVNNKNDCFNNKKATRLIQITEKEIPAVKTMYKDNTFWNLDICKKLGVAKPPSFNTTLHFYLNNITNPEVKYPAFLSYSGITDKQKHYQSPTLNISQILILEYLNSSWHGGSEFWLKQTNKNKIQPIFTVYYKDIDNIIYKTSNMNNLTESNFIHSKPI